MGLTQTNHVADTQTDRNFGPTAINCSEFQISLLFGPLRSPFLGGILDKCYNEPTSGMCPEVNTTLAFGTISALLRYREGYY